MWVNDYAQGQNTLFPESLDDKMEPGSTVRLINTIVDQLDTSSVIDTYKGGGTSSYHPRMLHLIASHLFSLTDVQ